MCKKEGLDIKLEGIIPKLREINPELIVADRTAGGEYENYITPEQTIPENVISVPWESCLTLGENYHYIYDDDYKYVTSYYDYYNYHSSFLFSRNENSFICNFDNSIILCFDESY